MTQRAEREQEAERRRRIAAVFGEPLPDDTSDDRPEGWGEDSSTGAADDEWLRREVPPHHG